MESPSVSNSAPTAGTRFTLSATVRNDGDGDSGVTTLRYYRSTDATITTSDTVVGTDTVTGLAASGSANESVELVARSTPGTYYYGACVDAVAEESDTTNNCSSSVEVDVRELQEESQGTPDLVVVSPSVSNSGPTAGTKFTLSATVRNDGDGASEATTLRYYQSTDATIATSDTEIGTDALTGIGVSGSSSGSVEVTAQSTPGTYYYGACVDAVTDESDDTNNCSSSVRVNVPEPQEQSQGYPDLTIQAVSAATAPGGTYPGESFTLSATVRNDGDGASEATTLRYYQSTDATISTSDTEMGTDTVAGIDASENTSESVDLTAPANPGTYYYGACVDAVEDESDTTNNCSSSVQINVLELQNPPNLVVESPSVNNNSPDAEAMFTLSATVRNNGSGASEATTLRYYRSTDATITTSDTEVDTDTVAGLDASESSSESVDLTAPQDPGTYYYGACVDSVTDESDTTNNCSSSVEVNVQGYPDLTVSSPSVNDSGPAAGASFTLSATVRNDGDGEATATTLRYYRSTDSTITTSDAEVGTDAVSKLAASGTSAQSISLTAPSTAGAYYYGACVDTVTDESDTTNNCSSSVQITVPEPPVYPDLVVGVPLVNDSGPETGAAFTLSATVRNSSEGEAPATTLRYYRSTDATITTSDTEVGTDDVEALAASGTSAESISLTAPSTAGTYYYGACVDSVTDESDTTNNCSSSVKVDVEEPKFPDLEVGTPTVDDSSPETGATFTLSATVSNTGDGESPTTTLRYYRSMDSAITTSDTEVGTDDIGTLTASGTSAESISLTAPSTAGTYYYGACVDSVTDESDTTDNCSSSVQVDVEEPKYPDLEVGTPTVDESSPETSATFALSATVSNTGDAEAPATTLRYYRSTDATITTSDTEVGTDAVEALAASGTSAESISLTAPSDASTYYYGACVDSVADESDTTDNCSSSVQVDVTEPSRGSGSPDLKMLRLSTDTNSNSDSAIGRAQIVKSIVVIVSPVQINPGTTFGMSASVLNDGDGDAAATTMRFYQSSDSTITTSDTQVGTDEVEALGPSERGGGSTDVTAPSSPGTYYYGACVDAVAGESDTTNNCIGSVEIMVLDPTKPDLLVQTPKANPKILDPGESFTLTAIVRNIALVGDTDETTTLRYYQSTTSSTITTSDTQVGTDEVPGLSGRGKSEQSISLTAPSDPGTYYYGACVDSVTDESDTTNNCSSGTQVLVRE